MAAMKNWEIDLFAGDLRKLRFVTSACRYDMHEPDEQGVTALVTGTRLDNAGVAGEINIHLNREGGRSMTIDLASLIALARMAVLPEHDSN